MQTSALRVLWSTVAWQSCTGGGSDYKLWTGASAWTCYLHITWHTSEFGKNSLLFIIQGECDTINTNGLIFILGERIGQKFVAFDLGWSWGNVKTFANCEAREKRCAVCSSVICQMMLVVLKQNKKPWLMREGVLCLQGWLSSAFIFL